MAITVRMPQLGESVTEGTIGTWLVQPGQRVDRFESLVEVITDKVNAEVPSPASGTVGEILAAEGQRLSVGEPICTLEGVTEAGDEADVPEISAAAEPSPAAPPEEPESVTATPVTGEVEPAEATDSTSPALPAVQVAAPGFISPAVRALADEHSLDISQVRGTGFQGRITKRDLLLFLEGGGAQPTAPPAPPERPQPVASAPPRPGDVVPHSPMRRSIAEHMVRSRHTAPHAWTMVEVDMSGVSASRATRRADFLAATGVELTFLHYAMKATCLALRAVPTMNAVYGEDAVTLHADVNLGLAVAIADGLIVPVVRGADRYSVAGLARAAAELIERARLGRATLDDVEGGTFTLNNAGTLGTIMSQAIINSPQAGILVMDAMVRRPVVIGDGIAIRPIMNLCLSFDHRVNDGASAARFLGAVKSSLEAVSADTSLF